MILENGHLKINEVHQGDCLELMKFIPDKSIDAIISDLPFYVVFTWHYGK